MVALAFPPNLLATATYNANLSAFAALGSWARLKHKATQRTMLMSYGYGDGGGGPTREMDENAAVLGDFPGLPRVTQGRVIGFFRPPGAESGDPPPPWTCTAAPTPRRGATSAPTAALSSCFTTPNFWAHGPLSSTWTTPTRARQWVGRGNWSA